MELNHCEWAQLATLKLIREMQEEYSEHPEVVEDLTNIGKVVDLAGNNLSRAEESVSALKSNAVLEQRDLFLKQIDRDIPKTLVDLGRIQPIFMHPYLIGAPIEPMAESLKVSHAELASQALSKADLHAPTLAEDKDLAHPATRHPEAGAQLHTPYRRPLPRTSQDTNGQTAQLLQPPEEATQTGPPRQAEASGEEDGPPAAPTRKPFREGSGVAPPTTLSGTVRDSLGRHAANWKLYGATFWQLQIVKRGMAWAFHSHPPLSTHPIPFNIANPLKRTIMHQCIQSMHQKGAIERVLDLSSPGFYSLIFLRPKKNGELRPIIDLSSLNKHICTPTFHMESAQSVRAALTQGQWAASIDLLDAYYHVPVRKSFRKYLRFATNNEAWQFRALPFGLSVAPAVFTGILALVSSICHKQGIKIHLYLDDWLIRANSPEVVKKHVKFILTLMQDLGLFLNLEKSQLTPTQNFTFLGYHYNLARGTVQPTPENISKLVSKAHTLLKNREGTAEQWLSMIGSANAAAPLTPFGRLPVCPMEIHVRQRWQWSPDIPHILKTIIPVSPEMEEILTWWQDPNNWNLTVTLTPFKPQRFLFTDASRYGWGAHMGPLTASGVWTNSEREEHINVLECRAVWLALKKFRATLQHSSVLLSTDNTTTMAYINKEGGTKSLPMYYVTRDLLLWCHSHNVRLKAVHILGSMNVMADLLSRDAHTVNTEWSLHPQVTQLIWDTWYTPQIDLFATLYNRKLPQYVSPFPDEEAVAVDALSLSWDNMTAYAFPPFAIMKKVAQKLEQSSNCKMLLVAPHWPNQSWFAVLTDLSIAPPIRLPLRYDLLKQPVQELYHQNLQILNLHAWSLFSKT